MSKLEEAIRDLARRGEIGHMSLVPGTKGKWRGLFAPCSKMGLSLVEANDPVEALVGACEEAKLRQRAQFKDGEGKKRSKPEGEPEGNPYD